MKTDNDVHIDILNNPTETLNLELKSWINPAISKDQAKIILACIALYNEDGGNLIIGYDDKTCMPDKAKYQGEGWVRDQFKIDGLQKLISKHSSIKFALSLRFIENPEFQTLHPIITVGAGVKKLAITASSLICSETNKQLIYPDKIYTRTLSHNNTVSTAVAKTEDLDRVLEKCLDNREADIARFLRRHFTPNQIISLKNLFLSDQYNQLEHPQVESDMNEILDKNFNIYQKLIKKENIDMQQGCATFEVAFQVIGDSGSFRINYELIEKLKRYNPRHTGWPFWVVLMNASEEIKRPTFVDNGWQALISRADNLDFWRISEDGVFYHLRGVEEDFKVEKTESFIDGSLRIRRVAEVLSTGLSFARALEFNELSSIKFGFRWLGLNGRHLKFNRYDPTGRASYKNEVISIIDMPISTAKNSIYQYVETAVHGLFEAFRGMQVNTDTVKQITEEVVNSRK